MAKDKLYAGLETIVRFGMGGVIYMVVRPEGDTGADAGILLQGVYW